MNILGIETSSQTCSVALLTDKKYFDCQDSRANRHSQVLLGFVNQVLQKAGLPADQIQAIAVGNGPGSFTGLRLGIGVAQGLAYGLNIPTIGISSLHALALQAKADNIVAAVDARMGEVYWQCFSRNEQGRLSALNPPTLDKPENIGLVDPTLNWYGIGSGFDCYTELLTGLLSDPRNHAQAATPSADCVIKLALSQIEQNGMPSTIEITPAYIRNKVTG